MRSSTGRARRGGWAASVVAVVLAACSGGSAAQDVAVAIDGGSAQVALLGDVVVAADAGGTVTVRHATEPVPGHEAPMTHALVTPAEAGPPPVFTQGAGGIVPNPAVWGPCRGGDLAAAAGQCPAPADEGADGWDGRSYWALGAMLPGEERELPLSSELPDGDHILVCALHPALRLIVRVGAGDAQPPPRARTAAAEVDAAVNAATRGPIGGPGVVRAGVPLDDPAAYVAAFSPGRVLLTVGDSLTWQAGARAPVDVVFGADHEELSLSHTTPADGLPDGDATGWDGRGPLRSGFLSADATAGAAAAEWTVTFTRPGTYRYASRFADDMTGTVVVQDE